MNCKACDSKVIVGTKYCPTHKCRNSKCLNMVNKVNDKFNFYCMDHMWCGTEVVNGKICQGCLNCFLNDPDVPFEEKLPANSGNSDI